MILRFLDCTWYDDGMLVGSSVGITSLATEDWDYQVDYLHDLAVKMHQVHPASRRWPTWQVRLVHLTGSQDT